MRFYNSICEDTIKYCNSKVLDRENWKNWEGAVRWVTIGYYGYSGSINKIIVTHLNS